MPSIEELTILVVFGYFISLSAIGISLYLMAKREEQLALKRREKLKNEIADEVARSILNKK